MTAPAITAVAAREVLDCRGLPTVQVDLGLEDGTVATADVPSGRSTGSLEAAELRDGGGRFGGFGVRGAVANVNGEIREALVGAPLPPQRDLDACPDRARRHATRSRGSARTRSSASRSPAPGHAPRAPGCRCTAT